jgi:hypothetical protein
MLLIYSRENESGTCDPAEEKRIRGLHRAVTEEANRSNVFRGGEPLHPTFTATTVTVRNAKVLIADGPFEHTKQQLAGYYILDCGNLDEAIRWSAKLPTSCKGAEGCIEIRPIVDISNPAAESEGETGLQFDGHDYNGHNNID